MIHIEVIYQGDHCPSCYYMAEAVEHVIPKYVGIVKYTKIEYMKSKAHARRFYELSISLHGEEATKKRLKCAPIPSIFINGKLVFDCIPTLPELEAAIQKAALEDY
ncbi:MAG: thioredoxin-like protein [Desulfatiglandales bacterium]